MRLLSSVARAILSHLPPLIERREFLSEEFDTLLVSTWTSLADDPAPLLDEIKRLIQDEQTTVKKLAQEVVQQVAGDRPANDQQLVVSYLEQIPPTIRQHFRSPSNPAGNRRPPWFRLEKAEHLAPLLPRRVAYFRVGDRPLPGTDWELDCLLGTGTLSEVWKARSYKEPTTAALHFCLDRHVSDTLKQEAKNLSQQLGQARHPGLLLPRRFWLHVNPLCLEYDWIEGGNLCGMMAELHSRGLATPETVTRWLVHLASAIGFAHRLKSPLVHRALKPGNILVQSGSDGRLSFRVTNLGLGNLYPVNRLTANSLAYVPPERFHGAAADPREDIHALGMLWYHMLLGDWTLPRPVGHSWRRRLTERGLIAPLLTLLEACLDDDPSERPANAAELATQLQAALTKPVPPPAPEPVVEPPPPTIPVTPTSAPAEPIALPQLVNSIGMKLIRLPAGRFWMGTPEDEAGRNPDESPRHPVVFRQPIYLGIYPVTQEEYQFVMGQNPSWFCSGTRTGRYPVENVTWPLAVEFCQRLSKLPAEKEQGRVYYLPTEALWEYACRAGTETPVPWGDSLSSSQANFDGRFPYGSAAPGASLQRPTPVGAYPANPWGLFDMLGNVWEWCADWFAPELSGNEEHDPTGPASGTQRVARGGSWGSQGRSCRSGVRRGMEPETVQNFVGFRVMCPAPPE